jgi:hypothetical protein
MVEGNGLSLALLDALEFIRTVLLNFTPNPFGST